MRPELHYIQSCRAIFSKNQNLHTSLVIIVWISPHSSVIRMFVIHVFFLYFADILIATTSAKLR